MLYVSFFISGGCGTKRRAGQGNQRESRVLLTGSDEVPMIPNPLEVVTGRTPKTVVGL